MAQIESIDWDAKRFYLHVDTITNGFDSWEAVAEVKELQQANANNEQNYGLFLEREGKVSKGGGRFTPRYVSFRPGWRGVPYGQVSHQLDLLVEMVSDEEISDRDVFDRSGLSVQVDIDPVYQQVEIIQISGGSGLDATQSAQLASINSKTSQMAFTNVNQLDVNVKALNDATLQGSGSEGDLWRG